MMILFCVKHKLFFIHYDIISGNIHILLVVYSAVDMFENVNIEVLFSNNYNPM